MMKLGILSDTHNNIPNLLRALSIFKDEGIIQLLHCGDMADMLTARQMVGFDVIYINGNSDRTAEAVSHTVWALNPQNEIPGDVFTGELDGIKIGATHGHLTGKLNKLIKSRSIKYVFHGHTHRKRDEMIGKKRIINPGALGGARYEPRTVCIVNFEKNDVRFIPVSNW